MATKLVKPPVATSQVVLPILRPTKMVNTHRLVPAIHLKTKTIRFSECPSKFRPIYTTRVAQESSGLVENDNELEEKEPSDNRALAQVKIDIYQAIKGSNRGIFGVPSAKKSEIEGQLKQLKSQNPTPYPTLNLKKVGGCWKLVYSTITILGSKRTKLGLRHFITLGDFFLTIDVEEGKTVNVIKFNVRGLNILNGQLTIESSFKIASKSRIDIHYNNSTITPDQLMNVFRKKYDLLLSIFNPEGWFEISYLDDTMMLGRDDKGNIFLLERLEENTP